MTASAASSSTARQQGPLVLGPAVGVGAVGDAGDLLVAQPGAASDGHVVAPHVVAPRVDADAQDHQLGVGARQPAPRHEPPGEPQPRPEQPAMAGQGGEHARRGARARAQADDAADGRVDGPDLRAPARSDARGRRPPRPRREGGHRRPTSATKRSLAQAHGELVDRRHEALHEIGEADVVRRVDQRAVAHDAVEDAAGRVLGRGRAAAELGGEGAHARVVAVDAGDVDGVDQAGVDAARADQRHADAVAAQVEAQDLGHAAQAELRRAVGRVPGQADAGRRRRRR